MRLDSGSSTWNGVQGCDFPHVHYTVCICRPYHSAWNIITAPISLYDLPMTVNSKSTTKNAADFIIFNICAKQKTLSPSWICRWLLVWQDNAPSVYSITIGVAKASQVSKDSSRTMRMITGIMMHTTLYSWPRQNILKNETS